ncbi:MAG: 4-hydroxy-3-methylbut-2-enyl diphosphate reductase, partial [Oscillospiraceae bacterium]|nr:4-hydroxy-3-methylbut-2-enyl diphosphate reductase [Oscillospiraceae bacterium]
MGEVSIRIAKTAGFCFGVARAIKLCEDLIENATPAVTLGPIIHNRQVTKAFEERGLRAVSSPKEADGAVLVIRSHGVGPKVYAEIDELSLRFVDATCPDVAAIQKKVQTGREEGRTVLIAGDKNHPEVVGIMGFAGENCHVFETREELCEKIFPETGDVPVLVVAQTTFNLLQYKVLQEAVKALYSDVTVYDTVCRATVERQAEARRLSERCDVCIVVGDKDSSNTRKLLDICGKKAVTYSVESKDELKAFMLRGVDVVGVTAGASTPAPVIEEVLERMDEMIKENGDTVAEVEEVGEVEVSEQVPDIAAEEPETGVKEEEFNFETALEDSLRPVHRNQRVIGVVTQIRPNEVVVDIGSKHTGIIPVEELSDDSSKEPSDIVSVGDKLNLLVIGTNDQEGITTLSKKRLDSSEGLDLLTTAAEEGTILDAYVTELVNKGLIAVIKGVRVFVPASQATLRHGADYDKLLRTNVRIKILEVNPARRRAIGSIRAVLQEELAVKREAFWESVEV